MGKTKQWFFRGWVVSLLAVLSIVFFIACSVDDEANSFDNGSVGTGDFTGITQQSDVRFSVGLRGEENFIPVQSGQLAKRNGRWVISVEWLPKYQGRVRELEIKAVGTYLPDEIKNASVATNVTLLVQGKNVYEPTEEQAVAIHDPILGGWVQEETKFAMIDTADTAMLVMMFSAALNNFARNNGATLTRPINLLAEFNEVVVGRYAPIFTGTQRAEPVAATRPDEPISVLDSWTDGERNYYVINAGHIRNSLLMENGFNYSGFGHIGITTTTTTEISMTESRTNTVSNSIVVSTGSSTTNTISLVEAVTSKNENKISGEVEFKVKASIKAGYEHTWGNETTLSNTTSEEKSRSFETATGRTSEISTSFERSVTESWSRSTTLAANSGDPAGYYRYAWYVVSDVYFIVSTSLDNQELFSWQVVSVPRERYELRQEYSPTKFDNSPQAEARIIFADDFYKRLPPLGDTYRLTTNVNIANGGRILRSPNAVRFYAGTQVTLTAIPNTHYEFEGWTGVPEGVNASNAVITITMNSDLALTANFVPKQYTLTTSTTGSGSVSRSINQETYSYGTQITLTATPSNHRHKFDRWEGAPDEVNAIDSQITFNISGNLTLNARFREGVRNPIMSSPFNIAGTHTYNLPENVKFPAEIEIYAFGAGGGGQGGNWRQSGLGSCKGTGGGGGGGAAVGVNFVVRERTTFNVIVGEGGTRGESARSSAQGHSGGQGGETSVNWDGKTLIARGGAGGAARIGGGGGTTSIPSGILFVSEPTILSGGRGQDGSETCSAVGANNNPRSGGNGGAGANISGLGSGGNGGIGGYSDFNDNGDNSHGNKGADGLVVIRVTWWE